MLARSLSIGCAQGNEREELGRASSEFTRANPWPLCERELRAKGSTTLVHDVHALLALRLTEGRLDLSSALLSSWSYGGRRGTRRCERRVAMCLIQGGVLLRCDRHVPSLRDILSLHRVGRDVQSRDFAPALRRLRNMREIAH